MSGSGFDWNTTRPLTPFQILLASLLPGSIGVVGFHIVLPKLVSGGTPALIAWPVVASTMLFLFSFVAIYLLKREAKELSISLRQRMCLQKVSLKKWGVITLIVLLAMILMSGIQSQIPSLLQAIDYHIPEYMPFFLRGIDPTVETDPNVLSPGLQLQGAYILLPLIAITLFLNIFVEEFYFRAWMLPRLSHYGRMGWVINGVMFACYHLFQLWIFPVILVGSLLFAFIVYYSKSVYPALVYHFILNFMFSILGLVALIIK